MSGTKRKNRNADKDGESVEDVGVDADADAAAAAADVIAEGLMTAASPSGTGGDYDADTLEDVSTTAATTNPSGTEEEHHPRSKFDVRQRVIARDEDGLLYFSDIRRKMYGRNHRQNQSALQTIGMGTEIFDVDERKKLAGNGQGRRGGDDDNANVTIIDRSEWMYFVHYEGWKTLWDRWVTEDDILEATPENIKLMESIQGVHRSLQKEFKAKTQQRKIKDGGLFIKMWKEQLDALMESWNNDNCNGGSSSSRSSKSGQNQTTTTTTESTNTSSSGVDKPPACKKQRTVRADIQRRKEEEEEQIKELSTLALTSSLTKRKPAHAQALPFAFGLKRVLVEDWEIVNGISSTTSSMSVDNWKKICMVHVLPPKLTIRDVLRQYLEEKGVHWDHAKEDSTAKLAAVASGTIETSLSPPPPPLPPPSSSSSSSRENVDEDNLAGQRPATSSSSSTRVNGDDDEIKRPDGKNEGEKQKNDMTGNEEKSHPEDVARSVSETGMSGSDGKTQSSDVQEEDPSKQWIDMVDGICMYFEQSLTSRLLYPSEFAQLLAIESAARKKKGTNEGEDVATKTGSTASLECKIDVYGCEHLLRLLSIMPRILEEHFRDVQDRRRKRTQQLRVAVSKGDEDTTETNNDEFNADMMAKAAFEESSKTIMAKLQDLTRFLQKHQSKVFCQRYRKLTEAEIKIEEKFMRRQMRKLEKKVQSD